MLQKLLKSNNFVTFVIVQIKVMVVEDIFLNLQFCNKFSFLTKKFQNKFF